MKTIEYGINDTAEYKVLKLGELKFSRVKSMSVLRNELNSFGYDYSIPDIKELFDSLIAGEFNEPINRKHKHCFDCIFTDTEYENLIKYEEEYNFSYPTIAYKPQILAWIEKMFKHAEERQWYETYWFIDLHGVISKPDYRKTAKEIEYYPYVKETLQFLTKNRPDIILILFTSSYPDEVKVYMETFKNDNIFFKYVNENPEIADAKGNFGCYDKKPYYNVLMDDKCGFDPEDWQQIYEYFLYSEYKPDPTWSTKYKESYHK